MSVTSENTPGEKKPCTKGHTVNDPIGIYIQDTATATESRLEAGRSLQEGNREELLIVHSLSSWRGENVIKGEAVQLINILKVSQLFTQKWLILSYEHDGWF